MINKFDRYNGKYKRINGLQAFGFAYFAIIFILIIICLFLNKDSMLDILILSLIFGVIPLAFTIAGTIKMLYEKLDIWIIDNDSNLYYIKVNGNLGDYFRIKNKLNDIHMLEFTFKKRSVNNDCSIYKIEKINYISDKKNGLKINAIVYNEYYKKKKVMNIYIINNLTDFDEFHLFLKQKTIEK